VTNESALGGADWANDDDAIQTSIEKTLIRLSEVDMTLPRHNDVGGPVLAVRTVNALINKAENSLNLRSRKFVFFSVADFFIPPVGDILTCPAKGPIARGFVLASYARLWRCRQQQRVPLKRVAHWLRTTSIRKTVTRSPNIRGPLYASNKQAGKADT